MKKILTILAFLALVISVSAQDQTIFQRGQAGISNTTASAKVAAYNYTFLLKEMPSPYLYTYSAHLDDNTGANTATFVLSGSLDGINFKTITSVSYTGAGTDTTIIGGITSAPLSYKQLRFTVTPTDTIWVKSLFLNVLPIDL